jgi:LysR family hydrogen peroxide-inducible transcriptional activator
MNLRELKYVIAVADEGHFGRAATACHVSQPTLSGQIRKLEAELGVQLFERGRGPVRVTEAGAAVIKEARFVLAGAERIREVALAAQDPFGGQLSLGLIPTIAPYLIPRFVRSLRESLPQLSVTYREDITERLTEDLLSGALDAAVLATPPEDDGLEAIPLFSEPFRLVMPDGHALAGQDRPPMQSVDRDELLLLTEGHCFRDQALAVCELGPPRKSSLRATSLETLVNLVSQGMGVTLVPALALRHETDPSLIVRPLADSSAARDVVLTVRRSFPRRQLADRVAEIIRAGLPDSVEVAA